MTRPTSHRVPRPALRLRIAATGLALAGLLATVLVDAPSASAAKYPSWDEVMAARGQESAKQEQITKIRGVISGLSDQVQEAEAEAKRLGDDFFDAQSEAQEAAATEQKLRAEADEHAEIAERSASQAGQFAAQMARHGGADVTASVLAEGEDARDLLYDLGALSKLSEQAERVEAAASADASVARSLTAQADRASKALDELAAEAERKMQAAQAAADKVQAAYDEQQENKARLDAQLATLTSGRVRTEAEFAEGEKVRKAAEEKARQEAEAARQREAQRLADAQAAAANRGGGGGGGAPAPAAGGGGGGGGVGSGSGTGWVRPGGGYVISPYGYRVHPITGRVTKHDGLDLTSGCSTAIVAASSGTVEYVGWYGGYGNYVRINHGGGVSTAYGHIVNGGFRVSPGQRVSAGQLIALVGSTGNSTGCHLHYEVHINGATIDPAPFMAARGVRL
ncbi:MULTISPECIES: M23 family metallopeptidase [unclassified Curtobacterium]|uniref:M23 family metallopeptidase n=1 Tax=unclassified Curtobacterium TaxID=257496 RepID=UPI0020401D96|nr:MULTISPECIES: M23 family metallopeptidase [unclassified Curtobacterium]MCM3503521.1 peptidoglycan DD-metalloendopeptidase family protein [Curtobacterium sp. ODYSSEY 48 V2]MCM3522005.1 peptidoglycan DD-metalloendopeptidase family protein [Curtobacterium sp. P97]MDB6428497.1 peptidoglycan DD-metalloendopeptidase family protein [Curtobacterium sp. 20TX0008]MDP9737151.1 murein DD-endopeptidase MepM/ murein hydrolase activator NlpD [Curtobacterium sp. 260]MDT0211512.1 peptidoglycan DD-metalloend